MKRRSESELDAERELQLAQLVDQLVTRIQNGEQVDLEQVGRDHPEHLAELRQLWGAIAVTQAMGWQSRSAVSESPPADARDLSNARVPLPLRVGDYLLEQEIGRGGMGVVYRARQVSLDRDVAVKMILKGDLASESDRQRFLQEARAAAKLNHPNIVPVIEVGDHNGQLFISMRLISGMNLTQLLADGPIDQRRAAEIMIAVARAIGFAHSQGILHRDLKPSNVLLGRSGAPYVADFGLAKEQAGTTSLSGSDVVLGTPAYMSPEQAAGARGQVGPASDVYSLGAILYHMLTGRPPFQGGSPVETIMLVLEQDPIPLRLSNPAVDRRLEMIVMRCLQKPQDLRYPSAGALADDLAAFLNDEPISASEGRFTQVIASWFRETHHARILERWGLLWMWHGVVLLLACLATNLLLWMGDLHRWHYFLMWSCGFGTWAGVFWSLRRRQGPVTFVERQIAHAWAASLAATMLLFPVEAILGLPVLTLSPVLALIAGSTFVFKAGILSGIFYVPAAVLYATALVMAWIPTFSTLLFGVIAGGCFFVYGWKYHLQSRQS